MVLDAIEARRRTFEHLFVLGLNRGEFPRVVREDPLLPDPARRALGQLVPDIREKRLGHEEERFLFAQLLGAGRRVSLSMSQQDGEGKILHPSSFWVNLRLHGVGDTVESLVPTQESPWRTAVAVGLTQERPTMETMALPNSLWALQSATVGFDGLVEPFIGNIGPAVHPADSRGRPVFVTSLESTARCPWQAYLVRELGVEARPDPWGPLPSMSRHLLGRVVHAVVERAVVASRGEIAEGCLSPMVWPSDSTLASWAEEEAAACLAKDGVAWRGFAQALTHTVLGMIEQLRDLEFGLEGIYGGEVDGLWSEPGEGDVHYRADRVAQSAGRTVITDFKVGRPPTTHKTEVTRRAKLVEAVRQGSLLQALVYARSRPGAVGRYLYLDHRLEVPQRVFEFSDSDEELVSAMDLIVDEIRDTRRLGAMFPRVSLAGTDKIPPACEHCHVREACSVSDSARRRQIMATAPSPAEAPLSVARARMWWRGGEST